MAGLAEEIENIFPAGFQATNDTMPHAMRHVILLYHQVRDATLILSLKVKWIFSKSFGISDFPEQSA